jgi:dual specificity MAP kinase phosphatase
MGNSNNAPMVIQPGPDMLEFCNLIWTFEDGSPFLYLGEAGAALFPVSILQKYNIHHILNVTGSEPNVHKYGLNYMRLNIPDSVEFDIFPYFHSSYHFIRDAYEKKQGVLVHCQAGISRSTAIVIAYLMRQFKMTLRDSIMHIKDKRKVIRPNYGFYQSLAQLELKLKLANECTLTYYDFVNTLELT